MKKIVLTFGLISGAIITGMMLIVVNIMYSGTGFKENDLAGYATMIIAFAFIFVGIKSYRDKYNNGVISFGKAFRLGLYISLIASTMYVGVWLIDYYCFHPDFMDRYTQCVMDNAREKGATAAQLAQQSKDMAKYTELYKNPLFVILLTYAEVLPVGLLVSAISALILKRKVAKKAV